MINLAPDLTGFIDLDGGVLVLHSGEPVAIACPTCPLTNVDADPLCSFGDSLDADTDTWVCSEGHRFAIEVYNRKGSPQLRVSAA